MKLRLSVTNGWRPPFFCCGTQWDSHVWQMPTTTMIDIWTWSAMGCPGQVWEFPLQTFPSPHQIKWPEEICQTSDNGPDKKQAQLSNNDQLVERGCPSHLPCQSSIWINHHIIRNEEASCEERHSEQCECPVSAIMSAATNPCRTRLSVKWHSVRSEK